MKIIIIILSCVVVLGVLYFLGIQFYKLGQLLKNRHPIIYRFYVIFWIFFIFIISIGTLMSLYGDIKRKEREEERQRQKAIVTQQIQQLGSSQDLQKRIEKVRKQGATDVQIYYAIKDSPKYKQQIKTADDFMSDSEIAKELGLNID